MTVPRNPRRTGGPQTAMGFKAVAKNAIKTGAYAMKLVLPGEDANQFDDLEKQLVHDFQPVGMVEVAMVHDLAVLTWRRFRVDRVEHSVMLQAIQAPFSEGKLAQISGPSFLPNALQRLDPYRPATKEEFDDTVKLVAQLEALQAAQTSTGVTVRKEWPLAHAALAEWADSYNSDLDDVIKGKTGCGLDLRDAIQELLSDAETVIWLWENRETVEAVIRRARDERLLTCMQRINTQRINDDISRAFFRTLSELRKQQDWRSRRTAILLDDAIPTQCRTDPNIAEPVKFTDQTSSHLNGLLK